MRRVALLLGLLGAVLAQPAAAQNVNQVIVFGDSNVDSGWYRTRRLAFTPART